MAEHDSRTIERFWGKVGKGSASECWPWLRTIAAGPSGGYGVFCVGGRNRKAHRVVWEISFGPIPAGAGAHGTCVCHRCDNRRCVNPSHLFIGTHSDNMRDMFAKGRCLRAGDAHPAAKVTEKDVLAIRAASATGESQSSLAKRYGVTVANISLIRRGVTWSHVPMVAA